MTASKGLREGVRGLNRKSVAVAILLVVIMVYPFLWKQSFPLHLMIMILIFAIVATGWNILGGMAGQVSLGHAVYFGVGAYTSTVLFMYYGVTPWLGMLAGAAVAVVVSAVIGYPCFLLGGRYFTIATLVLGEAMMTLFLNWPWVGAAVGLFIPMKPESFITMQFHSSKLPYHYIALAFLALAIGVCELINRSQFGYYLRAIQGDPDAAESLGINITKYKLLAMAFSAAFAAIGGTLYAQYILYIDPTTVMFSTVSSQISLLAALGGMGSLFGPTLGAFVLIPLAEISRAYLGGGGRALNLLVYGVLVVLVTIFQPDGLISLGKRFRRSKRDGTAACG